MTIYIFNTLITPIDFDEEQEAEIWFCKITIERAKRILEYADVRKEEIVSAVGHEGTAKLLSQLLEREIKAERITVYMKPGDRGLHFFLKERLPEGKILSKEELEKLEYWIILSKHNGPIER